MAYFEPADIFFIITSIGVIAVSVIVVWIGVLLIRTLRNIQYISKRARNESDKLIQDVDTLRTEIKKEGTTVLRFFHSLGMLFFRRTKKKKK